MERIKFVLFHPKAPPQGWKCPKRFKLGLGPPWESSDSEEDSEIEMDELLLMASQRYEEQDKTRNGIVDKRNTHCVPKETKRNVLETFILECEKDREQVVTTEIDGLLLMASQQYEEQNRQKGVLQVLQDERRKCDEVESLKTPAHGCVEDVQRSRVVTTGDGKQESNVLQYGSPQSSLQVKAVRKGRVPVKTREQNGWAGAIWRDWARYRKSIPPTEEEGMQNDLKEELNKMSVAAINFWLCKFVIEVRRKDAKPYSPDTLHQICCGLLRLLKEADRAEVNILTDPIFPIFQPFRETLDARMKELKGTGSYQPKRADVISAVDENMLWDKSLLGDETPEQLISTMVFYIGLYFSLRSGNEHRRLRFKPPQIELFEPVNDRAYLRYIHRRYFKN